MTVDLDRDPLILLNVVSRLARVHSDKRAREYGMTRAQWIILVRVGREPGLSQQELADILEVEPISVGRLVDKLEERQLVERRRDPKDRRVWRLHNLPAAEPIIETIFSFREEFNAKIMTGFSQREVDDFIDKLLAMKANLTEDRDACGFCGNYKTTRNQ